jgi:hypothetical protein
VPLRDKRDFAAFDGQPLKENPATKMRKRGGLHAWAKTVEPSPSHRSFLRTETPYCEYRSQ